MSSAGNTNTSTSTSTSTSSNATNWKLKNLRGQVVWEGRDRESPSVRKVQDLLDNDLRSGLLTATSQIALTSYTIQTILYCPSKAIPAVLNALSCAFFRNEQGMIDTKRLFSIKMANKRSLCGRPIKKGDILWVCKQCGQDNTCVQCDDCFQLSDHTDHEVYFHRSSEGGGCCDCGDTEAWQESGTCSKHGLDPNAQGVDPLTVLPASLVLGLTAVLHGALLAVLQVSIAAVDGFNCPENNPFFRHYVQSSECDEELLVRLHNDDVHTYIEVTSGLKNCNISGVAARQLTEAVDKEGSADVCRTKSIQKVKDCWDSLGKLPLGLCVTTIPSRLVEAEAALPIVLGIWMQHLAASNDGLMRLICNAFMMSSVDLTEAAKSTICNVNVNLAELFSSDTSTTNRVPSLKPYPTHLPLRGNVPNSGSGSSNPPHVLLSLGVDGVAPSTSQKRAASTGVCTDLPVTPITRVDPFNSCDAEDIPFTPRIVFAVLIACSPYLAKAMKKCLNSIVIFLQQDTVFKLGYSQLLVHLYPTLLALFSHGIGTNSDSIFGTSVQVFTADSVVRMMSSDGVDTRPFRPHLAADEKPDGALMDHMAVSTNDINVDSAPPFSTNYISIAPTLVGAMLTSLKYAGLTKESINYINPSKQRLALSGKDSFLDSFVIKNKRIWHNCRDIEYIVGCSDRSLDFIYASDRGGNFTALDYWLELCSLLHGINSHTRIPRTENHVLHDDDRWLLAISLVVDLESVSTAVLQNLFAVGTQNQRTTTGGGDAGSQLDILSVITEKTFQHISKLESFLPKHDVEDVAEMFREREACAPSTTGRDIMMASVSIPDIDKNCSQSGDTEEERQMQWGGFDIVTPLPHLSAFTSTRFADQKQLLRCHWESTFTVEKRGMVSIVIPLGRFLAKTFICAAEAGVAEHDLSKYVMGFSDPSVSRPSSVRHGAATPTLNSPRFESGMPLSSLQSHEIGQSVKEGVPFEYGMKFGLNEMYNAMSNVTADMSATGSASISSVRNRLTGIRNTLNDISDMVQSVNVVEQYGGMESVDDVEEPWSESPVSARFKSVCLVCEYALRNLSFAAQVNRNMWRRNGTSVANIIHNYGRPVFSRNFRDLDIASIQLGILWLGPEVVLRNMVTVFEVFPDIVEDDDEVEGSENVPILDKKDSDKGLFSSKTISGMYGKDSPDKACSQNNIEAEKGSSEKKTRRKSSGLRELKASDVSTEEKGVMMCEMLKVLSQTITYLPCDLSGSDSFTMKDGEEEESKEDTYGAELRSNLCDSREGLMQALDRLILHMILSGQRSLSKLSTAKHMIGKDNAVSDAMIEDSVRRVCTAASDVGTKTSTKKLSFDVNPTIAVQLFDPEYPFLTSSDLHVAAENVKSLVESMQTAKNGQLDDSGGIPVIAATALPKPHPLFLPTRYCLLSSAYFLKILCSVTEYLVEPDNSEKVKADRIRGIISSPHPLEPSVLSELACRVVHLTTLRLHILSDDVHINSSSNATDWEVRLIRAMGSLYALTTQGVVPAFPPPAGLKWVLVRHWQRGGRARDVLRGVGIDFSDAPLFSQHTSAIDSKATSCHEDAATELSEKTNEKDATMTAREERDLELQVRKEAAQTRAMSFIKKQAESFLKSLQNDSVDKKEEVLGKEVALPECILCREVTASTLGYFVHIQPSTLLTRFQQAPSSITPGIDDDETYRSRESLCCSVPSPTGDAIHCNSADDPRYVVTSSVLSVYIDDQSGKSDTQVEHHGLPLYTKRVKSPEFAVHMSPSSVETVPRSGVYLRPGQVVEVLRRVQQWVKVSAVITKDDMTDENTKSSRGHNKKQEVIGWVELYSYSSTRGNVKSHNATSGSIGSSMNYVVNLVPLKELEFARHGQARPFISSCGHAIHADCWDTYMASTLSSHINSRSYGRTSFVDPELGEVLCPMCKSVGNSFLPIYNHVVAQASTSSLTNSDSYGTVQGSWSSKECWIKAFHAAVLMGQAKGEVQPDKADTMTSYHSSLSCRTRGLVESVLAHAQTNFKSTSTGNFVVDEDDQSRDPYGYRSGTFQLHVNSFGSERRINLCSQMQNSLSMLRQLHSLWAAMSYSLLTSTLLKEQSSKSEPSEASLVNRRFFIPLFQCACRAMEWAFADETVTFDAAVVQPLEALLLLRPNFLDFSTTESTDNTHGLLVQLSRQSLPVIFDTICPEDNRNIHNLLNRLVASIFEDESNLTNTASIVVENGSCKLSPDIAACLWPILHQPMLTQDLHVLVIATVCSSSSSHCANSGEALLGRAVALSSLICIAKLIQILIEPNDTARSHIASSSSPGNEESSGKKRQFAAMRCDREINFSLGLCALRRHAREKVGLRSPPASCNVEEEECQLFEDVRLRWMPFLEYTRVVLSLLRDSSRNEGYSSTFDNGDVCVHLSCQERFIWLLHQTGLSGIVSSRSSEDDTDTGKTVDFSVGMLKELATGWGERYAAYYSIDLSHDATMHQSHPIWPRLVNKSLCESSSDEEEAAEWGSDDDEDDDDDDDDHIVDVDEEMMTGDFGFAEMLEAHRIGDLDGFFHGNNDDDVSTEGEDDRLNEMEVGEDEVTDVNQIINDQVISDQVLVNNILNEQHGTSTSIVGEGFSDFMYDDDNGDEIENDNSDDEADWQDEAEDSDWDEEGVGGVRDDMSRWLREMGEALASGRGLDLTAIQDRLSGLPGFEEMSARQIQAMRDALMAGQERIQERQRQTPQPQRDEDVHREVEGAEEETKDMGSYVAKPWPLYGVPPYFNPYHYSDTSSTCESDSAMRYQPLFTGSVTGAVNTIVSPSDRDAHYQLCVTDKSHRGVTPSNARLLIELPKMFTTLYKQAKIPPFSQKPRVALDEPAVCLVCGQLVSAGSRLPTPSATVRGRRESSISPGECTLHARACGAGTGIFFLVERCTVLLVNGPQSCLWPTLYLDKNGDAPTGGSIAGQNRPLFLARDRYAQLEKLYAEHKIVREIIRTRSNEERIIRSNWY